MKIYTKTGDSGETSLLSGKRVVKHHIRVESYGTIDELNSYIGLLRSQALDEATREILIRIQDRLFSLASILAAEGESPVELPEISEDDISFLEGEMDKISEKLPPLGQFILPGGHQVVAFCHIARTVCRRAERQLVRLSATAPLDGILIRFVNRLSDYLFVLSRKLSKDFQAEEIAWHPHTK